MRLHQQIVSRFHVFVVLLIFVNFPVPTQAEILLSLSLKERDIGLTGRAAWLARGFHIEISQ
jgi:hypothetical protein